MRVQQEFLRAQAAAAAAAATRIQKTWRGRRARSQIQLIDPASLGHAKKAIDDVALFAQIPQLTKQRLLTKLRRKRYPWRRRSSHKATPRTHSSSSSKAS